MLVLLVLRSSQCIVIRIVILGPLSTGPGTLHFIKPGDLRHTEGLLPLLPSGPDGVHSFHVAQGPALFNSASRDQGPGSSIEHRSKTPTLFESFRDADPGTLDPNSGGERGI